MDSSGINLMTYAKYGTESPRVDTPAYVNVGFEPGTPKANVPTATASEASLNSKKIDDTTAANTVANSARVSEKTTDVGGATESPDTARTTAATTASSDYKPGSPLPQAKHKDSTVGFRLPQTHQKAKPSSAGLYDQPFRGMGKDELLRHSSKPFWRRLRYICMTVVLVGWLALIITVVALVLVYPRCRDPQQQDWWQKAVVYRIYVRSFQDNDGNGIGDLDGVQSRLDYLKELGVNTISLCPIYLTAANSDSDMEIIDHTKIQHDLGSMGDFVRLVNKSHELGMKVVMDFIPNQTSDQHVWFRESSNSSATDNPKRNYYVWSTGLGLHYGQPPNNWVSVYGGKAWKEIFRNRNQWYLHQLQESQADLNLRSSEVKDELKHILQFWLNKGVDGFYIRDSGFLFEDYDLRNESMLPNATDLLDYHSYNHSYTYGQTEIYDMFARWRSFLDDYGNLTNKYILLFAHRHGSTEEVMRYYGHFNRDGVDFPLNVLCLELNEFSGGRGVANMVREWMGNLPAGRWANWLSGTDSSPRMIDRLGEKMVRPFLTLIMLMPGTPLVFQGDEIGMSRPLQDNETVMDRGQRNLTVRNPMQWNNKSDHAGFTSGTAGKPWMPLNQEFWLGVNVESQKAADDSLFYLFTNLTSLRAQYSAFHYGDYNEAQVDKNIFSFVRDYDGIKGFLVALNFANQSVTGNFYGTYETIPSEGSVTLVTGKDVGYAKGDKISTSGVNLGPYHGIVISWDYVAKEL